MKRIIVAMGLLDKLRETFSDDKQSKSFDVTFNEPKLGMTLAAGGEGQALVTAGLSLFFSTKVTSHEYTSDEDEGMRIP